MGILAGPRAIVQADSVTQERHPGGCPGRRRRLARLPVSVYRGGMSPYTARGRQPRDEDWDDDAVRALRAHLGMSQRQFADEVNARQQTVSEWETGRYRPRGASARLLSLIAEEAGYYGGAPEGGGSPPAAPPANPPAPPAGA